MQIPRYSELLAATVMTTDLFMISIMAFTLMVRFIVSETGMCSLPKALSLSRPKDFAFRECLVKPFQREFTLSVRDYKVR